MAPLVFLFNKLHAVSCNFSRAEASYSSVSLISEKNKARPTNPVGHRPVAYGSHNAIPVAAGFGLKRTGLQ